MKAYVFVIIVTFIINLVNEFLLMKKDKKFKIFNWILYLLSLIIICSVAGARTVDVGTDVKGYVYRLVNLAKTSPFFFYLKNSQSDLLFALLVYIGYLTKNINMVLFVIELAVAIPIFIYAYLERKRLSFTLCILIFLLTMYCQSLSMMRQSIAISLTILAYYFLDKNNVKKSLFIVLIAFLFHKTALIFLLIILISKIINKGKYNVYYTFLTILLLLIVTPFIDNLVSHSIYSNFLSDDAIVKQFSIGSIVKRFVFFIMWIMCINKANSSKKLNDISVGIIISIFSLYCTIMSFVIPGMGRLGYYFYDLNCILIFYYFPFKFKQKKFVTVMTILMYLGLWWNMTAVPNDTSNVYPYKSEIINFLN